MYLISVKIDHTLTVKKKEFIVHDHISYYFKSMLNSFRHGFTKSKSAATNLFTGHDAVTTTMCSQGQCCPTYYDPSSVSDIVAHTLHLYKLSSYGLSTDYAS
jgi:hypothetical protein